MNLYAVHVSGFPESYVESFIVDALDSRDSKVVGNPVRVKAGNSPENCEYAVFIESRIFDLQYLARHIICRLRCYMTNRGNPPEKGSYAATVSPLRIDSASSSELPAAIRYDEGINGPL